MKAMPSLLPCFYSSNQFIDNLQPHVQGEVAVWEQEGREDKVRRGGREEIPLIQGKEQWLLFAGAAMKR